MGRVCFPGFEGVEMPRSTFDEPAVLPKPQLPPHLQRLFAPAMPPGAVGLTLNIRGDEIALGYRTAAGRMESRTFTLMAVTRWPD